MKKKKKEKPKQRSPELKIELEPDAASLFHQAVNNFSQTQWDLEKKEPPSPSAKQATTMNLKQELDLHGLTLEEAKNTVSQFIQDHADSGKGEVKLKIITGKGRHSTQKGGVLSRDIHSFVVKNFQNIIVSIESAPADTEIAEGVLWRGHFHLSIRRS